MIVPFGCNLLLRRGRAKVPVWPPSTFFKLNFMAKFFLKLICFLTSRLDDMHIELLGIRVILAYIEEKIWKGHQQSCSGSSENGSNTSWSGGTSSDRSCGFTCKWRNVSSLSSNRLKESFFSDSCVESYLVVFLTYFLLATKERSSSDRPVFPSLQRLLAISNVNVPSSFGSIDGGIGGSLLE